ncbi:MAG: 1-acyl-sn-glycerol-3-phosphate acyltransferase [Oscillospiraceae bacterium]|nr:1-acyl-sn-glycerol-3-phosphate acyltransferase [Oscillospiraceae bacterium]
MNRFYQFIMLLTWPFVNLIFPCRTVGKENRPGAGAYLICANPSHALDPFMIAYSMGLGRQVHYMGKVELFRIPVIGSILRAIGMFAVDRDGGGAMAVKETMKLLKAGGKVGMFPEGTRVSTEDGSEAKTGAVRLSARMGVPIVPVYLPRRKRLFRFNRIVIGTPYIAELDKKPTPEDVERAAKELMAKIRQLGGVDK